MPERSPTQNAEGTSRISDPANMPLGVSQVVDAVTLAELVADELRDYREERRRLETDQRDLEQQLTQVKTDLRDQEQALAVQLHRGRTAGISVTRMSQLAGVSRNKAHRVLRLEDDWYGRFDRDPRTGLTMGAALELSILRSPLHVRAAWSETLERFGPEPTAAQTRVVVREWLRP